MKEGFQPRLDILPLAQQLLWRSLDGIDRLGFVLYGGTAIALRLGHRPSIDFDFFNDRPLDREALRKAFPFLNDAQTLQERSDTWTLLANSARSEFVKISFFNNIGIGRVASPERALGQDIQVASLDDLIATKVKVILQRIEAKDYRDIAAMIGAGVSLAKGLAAASLMYGASFQPSESLKALVYFEGGDLDALQVAEKRCLIEAVLRIGTLPKTSLASRRLAL